jgi:hypothetical protein
MGKHLFRIFVSLLFWAVIVFSCVFAQAQDALDNAGVLKLKVNGFGDDLIVSMIKSSKANFSISPEQLVELKKAGLSEKVIQAMVERQSVLGQPSVAFPSAASAAASMDLRKIQEMLPKEIATQDGQEIKLTAHPVMKSAMVQSKEKDFESALKKGIAAQAVSMAANGIVQTAVGSMGVAGIPVAGVAIDKVSSIFHKSKSIMEGYYLDFVSDLTSKNVFAAGKELSFFLPNTILPQDPLKIIALSARISEKENIRILSARRVQIPTNPRLGDPAIKVLKFEQNEIKSEISQEAKGVVIKLPGLSQGEYAIAQQESKSGNIMQPVIDFTIR